MPALGALAAESLHILVDAAVVGHLGREQLAVFALDGILIGAGDGPHLAGPMVGVASLASVPIAVAALVLDWRIVGVWSALVVLILVRLALMWRRFAGRRRLVTGWA